MAGTRSSSADAGVSFGAAGPGFGFARVDALPAQREHSAGAAGVSAGAVGAASTLLHSETAGAADAGFGADGVALCRLGKNTLLALLGFPLEPREPLALRRIRSLLFVLLPQVVPPPFFLCSL